jgi:hypothetical protein
MRRAEGTPHRLAPLRSSSRRYGVPSTRQEVRHAV